MPVHQQNSNRKNSMYLFIFVFSKLLQTLFTEVIYLCRPGDPTKTKWYTFFSCCCINHLRENNCWNMLREVIKQKEKSRSCSSVATAFVSKTDAANSGLMYLESLTNIFCLLSTANFVQGKSIQHEKLYFWKYLYCALVDYTKSRSCSSVSATFVSKTDAAKSGLIFLENLTNTFCLLQSNKCIFWLDCGHIFRLCK